MASVLDAHIERFRYLHAATPALRELTLSMEPGELVVVAGRPGSGKSTLSMCLAGVIPHFVGGEYAGRVAIDGQALNDMALPRMAGLVGFVQQAPANQLFCQSVEEDVAFGPENLGLDPSEIRRRVRVALDAVGITDLASRVPHQLSGGQQQRAVLAAVLALRPNCWIFDQPVAELDPRGRAEVYAAIRALHQAGQTVVVVEERLADVADLATRILLLEDGQLSRDRPPEVFFADPTYASFDSGLRVPVTVQLFHQLRARNIDLASVPLTPASLVARLPRSLVQAARGRTTPNRSRPAVGGSGSPVCSVVHVSHRYRDGHWALHDVSLDVYAGQCVALIGANGAGKSTLAKHLIALLRPTTGTVSVLGRDTRGQTPADLSQHVGFLFQDPDYQIFTLSVLDEVVFGLRAHKMPMHAARRRALDELARVGLAELADVHPYRLSRGQRQLLALASVLALDPKLVVVDEPSTGLDYAQTSAVMQRLETFRAEGSGVVLITHDMEMVLRYTDRCVVLADGKLVLDVPTRDIGQSISQLASADIRLPEVFDVEAALGLPPVFCAPEDITSALAPGPLPCGAT